MVIRPILFDSDSINQSLLSEPIVSERGLALAENSVTTPAIVIRATLLFGTPNHIFPSGPPVMPSGNVCPGAATTNWVKRLTQGTYGGADLDGRAIAGDDSCLAT